MFPEMVPKTDPFFVAFPFVKKLDPFPAPFLDPRCRCHFVEVWHVWPGLALISDEGGS